MLHTLSAVFANHKQVEGGALSEADQRQPPVSKDLPRPMVPFSRDELPGVCAMQASAVDECPAVTSRCLALHAGMPCARALFLLQAVAGGGLACRCSLLPCFMRRALG